MAMDEMLEFTRSIMVILDDWKLSGPAIMELLALPKGTPVRVLRRYRENTPFPNDVKVLERLTHIVGIAEALRTSYPHNPAMTSIWLNQKSKKFNNKIPLQIMTENGLDGLEEVRSHLDCAYDWQKNP